ncbi:hypothetical protein AB0K15_02515 [Amycolatopsis sp. NPDC049253]|uniref:hypothetical protein n=1 Tax=Amycolatopsis sp. NPDC049253 TaxID=3155274 RepID=UPI0034228C0F
MWGVVRKSRLLVVGLVLVCAGCGAGRHRFEETIDPCVVLEGDVVAPVTVGLHHEGSWPDESKAVSKADYESTACDVIYARQVGYTVERSNTRTLHLDIRRFNGEDAFSDAGRRFGAPWDDKVAGPWDHATIQDGQANAVFDNLAIHLEISDVSNVSLGLNTVAVTAGLLGAVVNRLKAHFG